jgi:hypothetical protein
MPRLSIRASEFSSSAVDLRDPQVGRIQVIVRGGVRNNSARSLRVGKQPLSHAERATGEWGEGWNFRTRFSSVSTAVPTLFLPRANSFSFTTSSSKTSRNVARPVKQNALPCWGRRFQDKRPPKPKPAPHVPSVERTPPFPSSQRRDGRFSAANVFSRSGNRQQPPELRVR